MERDIKLVEEDLRLGLMTADVAETVYGVVCILGERDKGWTVDEEATARAREKIKEKRKQMSMPAKEWWAGERKKIMAGQIGIEEVVDMQRSCLSWEKYRQEFYQFWQLPQEWKL